jgi:hypothetical protein
VTAAQLAERRSVASRFCAAMRPTAMTSVGATSSIWRSRYAAARALLGRGIAISRRAALEHVSDVHLIAPQAERTKHRFEQLPGTPTNGSPLAILFRARRLTDDHPARIPAADAEDGLGPAARADAPRAGGDHGTQRIPFNAVGETLRHRSEKLIWLGGRSGVGRALFCGTHAPASRRT